MPVAESSLGTSSFRHQSSSWRPRLNVLTTAYHVSLLNHTPVGDLVVFVSSRASNAEKLKAGDHLQTWATDDKGRTACSAVLHACAIFTLVRLRLCYGVHEPTALLVATLVLWAYNHLVSGSIEICANSVPQTTVRLDQSWTVESGKTWLESAPGSIRGYLTEFGNINDPGFGKRLLDVACGTLSTMPAWGLSQGFIKFLRSLQQTTPPVRPPALALST